MAGVKSKLDALLAEHTAKENGLPGVSLIVTRASGNMYEGSAGVRDLGKPDQPFTTDTVVWLASMSKAITSLAALICVERGLIGLDDDLREVIPELKNLPLVDRTQPFQAGNYTLQPTVKPVTLRHMLTNSNGILNPMRYPHARAYAKKHGIPPLPDCVRAAFRPTPAWFEAGAEWDYGLGVDYAGLAVEIMSGQRLGDFMAENIFGPLGMTLSAFSLTSEMMAKKAAPYVRKGTKIIPREREFFKLQQEQEIGGAGLWSSAGDYARFLRMILNGGKAPDGTVVIKRETLDMAIQGQLEPSAKESCNAQYKSPPPSPSKFGKAKRDHCLIGMVMEEDLVTGRGKGSVHWAGAANCDWFVDKKNDIALVLCTQIMPPDDPQYRKLLRQIETDLYKAL